MLSDLPAEKIAKELGVELVDESYFFTEARWREHRKALGLPEEPFPYPGKNFADSDSNDVPLALLPTGTVGAVALDVRGCIAAVTSTGGRTNKLAGRIGDTPSMAAGFWAEEWRVKGRLRRFLNQVRGKAPKVAVGVSGTGDGDVSFSQLITPLWLRSDMSFNSISYVWLPLQLLAVECDTFMSLLIKLQSTVLRNYATMVVSAELLLWARREMVRIFSFGFMCSNNQVRVVAMPLNCSGMYRGVIREDGVPKTAIFDDDELD